MNSDTSHWANLKETGTVAGLRFLYLVDKYLGRWVFRLVLWFVSVYFVLTQPLRRQASQQYLRYHAEHFPAQWRTAPSWRHTVRHFFQFGDAVLDKAIGWSRDIHEDEFDIAEPALVQDILNDQRGQLIIGTHFGNLEYCRSFMQEKKDKRINALVYERHSANFAKVMERINPQSRLRIYQVDELDLQTILELKARTDDGEWLFIAGDRQPVGSSERTVNADFLGHPAAMPVGPYQLARTLGCPVKLMFAWRQDQKIIFDLVPFADKVEFTPKNRQQAIAQYAQQFASELEKRCQQAPYQWFNFYPYWQSADS